MNFAYFVDRYKYQLAALFIISLSIAFCSIQSEPEKVWNLRSKIVKLTKHLQGLPYRLGGEDLDGFDCSGLVYYVYDSYGIKIPRTAQKQSKIKYDVSLRRAKPADILAFKFRRQWHTAIYVGDHQFIHAPNRRGVVRQEHLTPAWKKRLKKVISIIKE